MWVIDGSPKHYPTRAAALAAAKPAKLPKLNHAQVQYGAIYLATSNLGFATDTASASATYVAWRRCKQAHEADGVDCLPELREWKRALEAGDKYSVETVLRALPWLAGLQTACDLPGVGNG